MGRSWVAPGVPARLAALCVAFVAHARAAPEPALPPPPPPPPPPASSPAAAPYYPPPPTAPAQGLPSYYFAPALPDAPRAKELPAWSFRFGLAIGSTVSSDHEDTLNLDGYGGPRSGFDLSGWHSLGSTVGLGVRTSYRLRRLDGGSSQLANFPNAPDYSEDIVLGGATLPIWLGDEDLAFILTPIVGIGAGKVSFYGDGRWQAGPLFGGSAGIYLPHLHFGCDLGFDTIPVGKSGAADGRNNFGMLYLALVVGFDVH
ncbi:MAG TPA: hypothetical protein VGI10_12915 [Polyangiaceae bacterium]